MRMHRHRATRPSIRRRVPLAAALAAALLALSGAPALAQPTVKTAAIPSVLGVLTGLAADEAFDNAGTNPRFTDAVFPDRTYLTEGRVHNGRLFVQVKTAAELSALSSPPDSPFTVDIEVTMTNDEGQTASGTITYELTYTRVNADGTPVQPSQVADRTQNTPPGTLISILAKNNFDDAGTNPKFTNAVFSDTKYYDSSFLHEDRGIVFVQAKSNEDLNAMSPRPSNPFTTTVQVTMTNDEGQTATGTITLETYYVQATTPTTPSQPTGPAPTLREGRGSINAPPATLVSIVAHVHFLNPGTNAKFTNAVFSDTTYYNTAMIRQDNGIIFIEAKSNADLRALSPPSNPFTTTVEATMSNDEGHTVTVTYTIETAYVSTPATDTTPATQPTLSQTTALAAAPGTLVTVAPADVFANAGTNARFTKAAFSSEAAYYEIAGISLATGELGVQAKTAAELRALASPPTSPFTLTAEVTMSNDEGQTATGTLTFETTYSRTEPPSEPATQPTVKSAAIALVLGTLTSIAADEAFDNAGTNPRFTGAVFPDRTYLTEGRVHNGLLFVQVKTAAELSALSSPPDSPFTVDIEVTMTNDEGQTASGTIIYEMTYTRVNADGTPVEPSLDEDLQPVNAPPGTHVGVRVDVFDNAGTNPRFTNAVFSNPEYLVAADTRISPGKDYLLVKVKSAAELNAMDSPPDNPFTFTAEVTMTNDAGQTATGTITYSTHYAKDSDEGQE